MPSRKHSRQNRHGVASVEAAVVMPLFILAFASVIFIRNLVLARQEAEAKARTCAWLYSAANCEPNAMPPGCSEILQRVSIAGRVSSEIEHALQGALIWPFDKVISRVLEPVLEAAFGSAVQATAPREFERPGLYRDNPSPVTGTYQLACNVSPTTPLQVAKEAWNAIRNAL